MRKLEVIRDLEAIPPFEKGIVTVGTFDGIHLAHRAIINRVIEVGKELKVPATLVTFHPHPKIVLEQANGYPLKLLTVIEEKVELIKKFDLDRMIIVPFTKEFSRRSPSDFVADVLCEKMGLKRLIVGFDHGFGKNRTGDIESLKRFGEQNDFQVEIVEPITDENGKISSTRIRNCLFNGEVEDAAKFLGRPYRITGEVVKGAGRGRGLNFPTANVEIENINKCIPENGVYTVKVLVEDKEYTGVMNIGLRPTFDEERKTLEVHILDFDRDIYNLEISIDFLTKIRDEKKFNSVELLKDAIQSDVEFSRNFVKNK